MAETTTTINRNGSASKLRKFDRTESERMIGSGDDVMAGLTADQLTNNSPQADDDDNNGDDDDYSDYGELPPPPDGGYGWVVCFASFMCNMVVDGIAYTFGIFLGQFVDYFGEGKGKVAWVGSLLSGVYLSAGPIVSALANKYGCRAVCIAGSVIGCAAFALSTLSTSVNMLMLTYGVIGGFGFGMIYLPAVVAVGYYFETKRSLATGIAVCGSGFGTFAFAPLASYLLQKLGWKHSLLIFSGMILSCAVFGAMMRPLTYPKKPKQKSLMQRIYEEKQLQLERGSFAGSFMVQLPDGTMERKLKMPLNTEPGVHSSVNLELLAQQVSGVGLQPVPTLPTITEAKVSELNNEEQQMPSLPQSPPTSIHNGQLEMKPKQQQQQQRSHRNSVTGSSPYATIVDIMTRNASQPAFGMDYHGLPKNGSVPSFQQQRSRKTSTSEKFQPSLAAIKAASRADLDAESGIGVTSSKLSLSHRQTDSGRMVRPMSRKDIFYSGSVTNLPLYQSQKSLTNYRQSVLSLTKYEKAMASAQRLDPLIEAERNREQYDLCPCLAIPDVVKSVINNMLDITLLKDPVFMLIGISNIFGMAGLYVPFVYLVDAAQMAGIDNDSASFLLSIIGITNTFGRVICGYVADFPAVNSLFLNNMCLLVCTMAVFLTPFCQSYTAFIIMSVAFGAAVSGYISLTSIILVDLLGLDKLTNAFGLLILFRGFAAIIGSPLAGAVYDATQSYDLPFYMAGCLFAISTVTSFMAPCLKRCTKSEETPIHIEALTPINEEPAEDMEEEEEDDQPITIVPKIIKTLPSPLHEGTEPQFSAIGNKKATTAPAAATTAATTATPTITRNTESKL